MASKNRHQEKLAQRRPWLQVLGLAVIVAAFLVGCGAAELAPTAQAVAQTAQAAAGKAVATNVPPGAGATAQAVAGTVISGAPGAVATAAAVATNVGPTVKAGVGGLVPTAQALATQAAGSTDGPEATVTGRVTRVDVAARTFTVQGTDGTNYDFTATTNSQVDLATLASDLATKRDVTVTYRNTTSPYEVISVR